MRGNVSQTDCIVVGAGLVGTILSIALNSLGLDVTLVEREIADSRTEKDARSLVLSSGTITILKNIGAWSAISRHCMPIEEVVVSEQGAFPRVTLKAFESGLDALGYSCPAQQLLKSLRAKALSNEKLTFFDGTKFSGMRPVKSGVTAELRSAYKSFEVDGKLVVGSDGIDSDVRKAAGIGVDGKAYNQQALVCKVSVSNPVEATAFERFTKYGVLAFIPVGVREYVSVHCLSDTESVSAKALPNDAYANLLEERLGGRLGVLQIAGPRYSYPLVRQKALSLHGPRAVLLGNSANVVHPNGAQGLNLGVRDVAMLVSLFDSNSTDIGSNQILTKYMDLRYRDHKAIHTYTDSLGELFLSKISAAVAARRLIMAVASVSVSLRRRIVASSTTADSRFLCV